MLQRQLAEPRPFVFENLFPCVLPAYHSEVTSAMWSPIRKHLMSLRKTINKSYVTVTPENK